MKRLLLILFLAGLGFQVLAHPIKMTTSKFSVDKKNGELIILINFFEDDFSAWLEKLYHKRDIDFAVADDTEKSMVSAYVNKKMLIRANKKAYLLQLNSLKRIEENVVQACFVIALKGQRIKSLEISDALLFDAFPEQVNIAHLDLPGNQSENVLQFIPSDSYKALNVNF